MGFLELQRQCGVSHQVRQGAQGGSRVAPGKLGLHALGEVIHGEGAYIHNLEPYWAEYQDNWRLDYNQKHSGDVYATHGLLDFPGATQEAP